MSLESKLTRGRLLHPATTLETEPRLHPALLKVFQSFGASAENVLSLPFDPANATRALEQIGEWMAQSEAGFDSLSTASFNNFPIPPPPSGEPFPKIHHEKRNITGVDGNTITLHIHRPVEVLKGTKPPALVYIHGGGMVFLKLEFAVFDRWMKYLAAYGGFVVIGVEFRNAWTPERWNPFPAGLNDCTSAIKWVYSRKEELGVGKIVLTGESGGANLAISSAIKANLEGWVDQVDGVFAIVPYISGIYGRWLKEKMLEAGFTSLVECDGYGFGISGCAVHAWIYDRDEHAANPTAWPYHATKKDLEGLPPIHINSNELDPLRDEAIEFYRKLVAAGAKATAYVKPGLTHAAEIQFGGVFPEEYYGIIADMKSFAAGL